MLSCHSGKGACQRPLSNQRRLRIGVGAPGAEREENAVLLTPLSQVRRGLSRGGGSLGERREMVSEAGWPRAGRGGCSATQPDAIAADLYLSVGVCAGERRWLGQVWRHSAPLGCARLHSAALGATRLHSAPLDTRSHSEPLGSARLLSAPLGLLCPPGLCSVPDSETAQTWLRPVLCCDSRLECGILRRDPSLQITGTRFPLRVPSLWAPGSRTHDSIFFLSSP